MTYRSTIRRSPSWLLLIASMVSVQLGSALSVRLIPELGAGGVAWLRLTMGALIFFAVARPPLHSIGRRDVLPLIGLGVCTGAMTLSFLFSIERIPLGTAVAIEFLGPLTVAAMRSRDRRGLIWPALAFIGVVLLTEAWNLRVDLIGICFAALAGICWGSYILLTQLVGDRFAGVGALSITIPIAAVVAAVIGIPQAAGHLTLELVAAAAGLALLLPVLPFALEMLALRRMTPSAFGTLMAVEPAIGVLLGLVVLSQFPSLVQTVGIILVVVAGACAQRSQGQGLRAASG